MSLMEFATWLEGQPFAVAIAEGATLFPWIESIHVLAIVTVVGSIFIVDLRLMGVASRDRAITRVSGELLPFTWVAFVVAVISGSLLFSSKAETYVENTEFKIKLCLIALAGLNMLFFQFVTYKDVAKWDTAPRPPQAVRLAGAISMMLWLLVIPFARWVGFTT